MYSQLFCEIYNQFGWNFYPESFSEELLAFLEANHIAVSSCLDLGCGTGVLCGCLHAHGIEAEGIDFSQGMVDVAKANYPALHFEQADMIQLHPTRRYDLVTCTGDALNHIFSPADVEQIFANVYQALHEGGLFIFDVLSEQEGQEVDAIPFVYDDKTTAEFSIRRSEDLVIELRTRVFECGVFQFEEVIREKVHDINLIRTLLEKTGFHVRQCADHLLPGSSSHSSTWYIVAEKR